MWLYLSTTVRLRERLIRLYTLARKEDGYSTETVVVTAILAALALLVFGTIIWNLVVEKSNSIDLG